MQMQPPPQAHIQPQQQGRYYKNNASAPPAAHPNKWQKQQAAQPQQWQPHQQQPWQWQHYQQLGGYHQQNRSRFQQMGRGRGRGNMGPNEIIQYQTGGFQTGSQRMQRPQQQQQQQGGYQNQQGGYQHHPQVQNISQRPLPTNYSYCWAHGYGVSAQHSSMTCMNCKQGHQSNTTRQYTMGGSQAGSHRLNL